MIGFVNSTYGLSAFFFSVIARELFPGETGALLTVLVVGTTVPILVGASIIRPKAHNSTVEERCQPEHEANEETPLRVGEEFYGGTTECPAVSESAALRAPTGGLEDVHGLGLFKSIDFWIIFGIVAMCEFVSKRLR